MAPSSPHPVARSSLVIALGVTICLGASPEVSEDTRFFLIRSNYSGKCLSFNVPHSGALVDCDGSPNQWFYWNNNNIKPAQNSNECITARAWEGPLYLHACDGSPTQAWNYSANQLALTENNVPKTGCLTYQVSQNRVVYLTSPTHIQDGFVLCTDPQEIFPDSQHQWHIFYPNELQVQKTPFQVMLPGHAGCLVANLSTLSVEFATICSDATEALFQQVWYFDDAHRIRSVGFFSNECMEAADNYFDIKRATCDDSVAAQRWYFEGGFLKNGRNGTMGKPQCLTIRTSPKPVRPILSTCDAPHEKLEQQVSLRNISWNHPAFLI